MIEAELVTIKPEHIFLQPRVVKFHHPYSELTVVDARALVDGVLFQQGPRTLIYDPSGSGLLAPEFYALRVGKGPKVDEIASAVTGRIVFDPRYHGNEDWSQVPTGRK